MPRTLSINTYTLVLHWPKWCSITRRIGGVACRWLHDHCTVEFIHTTTCVPLRGSMIHSTKHRIMILFNTEHIWTSIMTDGYELLKADRSLVPVAMHQFGMAEMVITALQATSHTQDSILFMSKAAIMCIVSYYNSTQRCCMCRSGMAWWQCAGDALCKYFARAEKYPSTDPSITLKHVLIHNQ